MTDCKFGDLQGGVSDNLMADRKRSLPTAEVSKTLECPPRRFYSELVITAIAILELLSEYFLKVDGSTCMRTEPCYLSVFEFKQSEKLHTA